MKITVTELRKIIREELTEGEWIDTRELPSRETGQVEPLALVQRIESSYHDLQEAFGEIDNEVHRALADALISDLETLMDK